MRAIILLSVGRGTGDETVGPDRAVAQWSLSTTDLETGSRQWDADILAVVLYGFHNSCLLYIHFNVLFSYMNKRGNCDFP
jgi:hypothetical protein